MFGARRMLKQASIVTERQATRFSEIFMVFHFSALHNPINMYRHEENARKSLVRRDTLIRESKDIEEGSKNIDKAYQNAQRALLYRSSEHEHVSHSLYL